MRLFGFGRKRQDAYKTPPEAAALRNRIEALLNENYPSLDQYRELANEMESVCRTLNAAIAAKDYAEEATRLRDDLSTRLSRLAAKINRNRKAADRNGAE